MARTALVRYRMPIGQALAIGFKAAIRNLIPFMALAAVVYVPWIVAMVELPNLVAYRHPGSAFVAALLIGIVLPSLLNNIVAGVVTFGVVQQLRGKPAGPGECLARGFTSLLPTLGTGLLAGLRIGLLLLLLIVPGIHEYCRLGVAVPVAILERAGPARAIGRSIELTRGSRGSLFAITLVIFVVDFVLGRVVHLAARELGLTAALIGSVAVTVWGSIWGACSGAASYYLLRKGKENLDLDELAQVFA